MASASARPRATWLQRVARVLLPVWLVYIVVNLGGALWDSRPVQT